jgi:hypothetical protein
MYGSRTEKRKEGKKEGPDGEKFVFRGKVVGEAAKFSVCDLRTTAFADLAI